MSEQPDSEDAETPTDQKAVDEISEETEQTDSAQSDDKKLPDQVVEEIAKEEKQAKPVQTLEEIAKDIIIEEPKERGQFTSLLITFSLIFGVFSFPFAIFKPSLFDWLPYSLEITGIITLLFIVSAVIVNKK